MMMMMMMIMGMKALSQHLALLFPSLILPSYPPSHSSFLVPCPGGAGSPLNRFHLFLNAHFSFSFSFSFLPLALSSAPACITRGPQFSRDITALVSLARPFSVSSVPFSFSHIACVFVPWCVRFTVDLAVPMPTALFIPHVSENSPEIVVNCPKVGYQAWITY